MGKQGRGVPVLLSPNELKLMEFIIQDTKLQADIFLFQSTGRQPLRGDRIMQFVTDNVEGLERPELIR
jgi:hypothetical protein